MLGCTLEANTSGFLHQACFDPEPTEYESDALPTEPLGLSPHILNKLFYFDLLQYLHVINFSGNSLFTLSVPSDSMDFLINPHDLILLPMRLKWLTIAFYKFFKIQLFIRLG